MPQLREIADWSESYITELPLGEYDWIDYKCSAWLTLDSNCLNSLSKYASAFSNFDGGYLVLGVKEPDSSTPPVIDAGGVPLSLKKDLKSWLEDKIPNLTNPPLSQLGVATIFPDTKNSAISEDHAIVVLRFYPSISAPHQAHDSKFYTRLGSKLAPISTQAILDIAQRRRHPILRSSIYLNINHPKNYNLHWKVHNDSDVMARHIGVRIQVPNSVGGYGIWFNNAVFDHNENNEYYFTLSTSNGGGAPLFPRGSLKQTFEMELVGAAQPPMNKTISEIIVTTYADSMPFTVERFPISSVLNVKRT